MMRGYYGYGYGPGDMMGGGGWIAGLVMMLFGTAVLVGIVLLIVWAVRAASGHGTAAGPTPPTSRAAHEDAVAIAKRRLASGEITAEQYQEIMRALGG